MKKIFLAILFSSSVSHALYIRADRADVGCEGAMRGRDAWLDIKVKGKVVVSINSGETEADANAGQAYCEGMIGLAQSSGHQYVYINTNATIDGDLIQVDGMTCR